MLPVPAERGLTSNSAWRCWNVSNQRRLGRGLEALLGRPLDADGTPQPAAEPRSELRVTAPDEKGDSLLHVRVDQIDSNPFQPRQDFDEAAIAELSESLQQHGLLQPLTVRRHGKRFQLVAGERRLRAAVRAGWSEVPVQV